MLDWGENKMPEINDEYIKQNRDKLDDIILCPGNLDELNSCESVRKSSKKYELAKHNYEGLVCRHVSTYIDEAFGEDDNIVYPHMLFQAGVMNEGYLGVVRYSEKIVVIGNKILFSYSGMPIKLKEKWWKKYFRR